MTSRSDGVQSLADRVLRGDPRAAARLITQIENGLPNALPVLKALYPATGRAYVVGITGPPGAGKSSLTDELTASLRSRQDRVGIIAVDPSSPFSGGAILADRVRMQRHALDDGVFIRSMATRGQLGGLARATLDAIDVLDAMGNEFILVETVGAGQAEVDIARTAHTTVVVAVPGLGDALQAFKAGVMEIGDIFVINKADRDGTDQLAAEIAGMLDQADPGPWRPPILRTVALRGEGVLGLLQMIERHRAYQSNGSPRPRRVRSTQVFRTLLQEHTAALAFAQLEAAGLLEATIDRITDRELDPHSAVEEAVKALGWSVRAREEQRYAA